MHFAVNPTGVFDGVAGSSRGFGHRMGVLLHPRNWPLHRGGAAEPFAFSFLVTEKRILPLLEPNWLKQGTKEMFRNAGVLVTFDKHYNRGAGQCLAL